MAVVVLPLASGETAPLCCVYGSETVITHPEKAEMTCSDMWISTLICAGFQTCLTNEGHCDYPSIKIKKTCYYRFLFAFVGTFLWSCITQRIHRNETTQSQTASTRGPAPLSEEEVAWDRCCSSIIIISSSSSALRWRPKRMVGDHQKDETNIGEHMPD